MLVQVKWCMKVKYLFCVCCRAWGLSCNCCIYVHECLVFCICCHARVPCSVFVVVFAWGLCVLCWLFKSFARPPTPNIVIAGAYWTLLFCVFFNLRSSRDIDTLWSCWMTSSTCISPCLACHYHQPSLGSCQFVRRPWWCIKYFLVKLNFNFCVAKCRAICIHIDMLMHGLLLCTLF